MVSKPRKYCLKVVDAIILWPFSSVADSKQKTVGICTRIYAEWLIVSHGMICNLWNTIQDVFQPSCSLSICEEISVFVLAFQEKLHINVHSVFHTYARGLVILKTKPCEKRGHNPFISRFPGLGHIRSPLCNSEIHLATLLSKMLMNLRQGWERIVQIC